MQNKLNTKPSVLSPVFSMDVTSQVESQNQYDSLVSTVFAHKLYFKEKENLNSFSFMCEYLLFLSIKNWVFVSKCMEHCVRTGFTPQSLTGG